jgi:hypothetical protein
MPLALAPAGCKLQSPADSKDKEFFAQCDLTEVVKRAAKASGVRLSDEGPVTNLGGKALARLRLRWRTLEWNFRGSPAAVGKFFRALVAELEKDAGRLGAGVTVRGESPLKEERVKEFVLRYVQQTAQGGVRVRVEGKGSKPTHDLVIRLEEKNEVTDG